MEKTNLFKNKLLLFRAKSIRLEKMFPVSEIRRALPINLAKIVSLSMCRAGSLSERVRIGFNFFSFVIKLNRNHGSTFTVKWLKSNQVALQKYLGGERLTSLRALEPNLPLPRLINGFPAIINRTDRHLIRSGSKSLIRFWLSMFGSYRIMLVVGKTKLNTIYDPFTGSSEFVLDLLSILRSQEKVFFLRLPSFSGWKPSLSPGTLVLSHKSSPSSHLSYQGLLADYWLLTRGNPLQRSIYNNIESYIAVVKKKFPVRRWTSLVSGLESLVSQISLNNLRFKKSCDMENGLSQFAIKEEAAGKIRVFALIDSISQSVLRPLHDACFDLIKTIPNDGTFNQDLSVKRSIEKSDKYGCAYSFDLSSATDRLPRVLTGFILENLFALEGLSESWQQLMADRTFNFPKSVGKKYPHLMVDCDNKYRYSVGQPMGGLSSWAGLAITHHWILQYCSWQCGNYTHWEERYEILGDDIVIFDSVLADRYLDVMKKLGVDINLSKSIISPAHRVFEFAKRTIIDGVNVSSISFQQVISQSSRGARVADSLTWVSQGLINTLSLLSSTLNKRGGTGSFNLKDVGMEALALLGLLFQKGIIEHRVVVESLINPQYKEDFDWDKASFGLPVRSILKHALLCLKGQGGEEKFPYPFSHEDLRKEVYDELESELSAIILQLALHKIKLLDRDYDQLINKAAHSLVHSVSDRIFLAGLSGFFEDLIMNLRGDMDVGELLDEVESTLYQHAKYSHITIRTSLSLLDKVEAMIFAYTYKIEISRVKYELDTSPIIDLVRKGVFGSKTRYWEIPNPTYS